MGLIFSELQKSTMVEVPAILSFSNYETLSLILRQDPFLLTFWGSTILREQLTLA
jgi:hypothetical protein